MNATAVLLHLWQTTVVLAVLFLLDCTLRRAPARVSHALWTFGLAKLFLPLALGSAVLRAAAAPALPVVEAVLYPFGDPSPVRADGASPRSLVVAAVAVAWIALALVQLWRLGRDLRRARRHVGTPFETTLLGRLGIPRDVVVVSDLAVVPLVAGLLRPRIVLPRRLVTALSTDELGAILLHEDAHRRRRDPLRSACHRFVAAIFCGYPPLYLVLRRLAATAEYACDEHVVRAGVSAPCYARALARALSLGLVAPTFAAPAVGAAGSLLQRRLRRLSTLNPGGLDMRLAHRLIVSIAVVTVAASFFWPTTRSAVAGDQPLAKLPAMRTSVAPVYPPEARELGVAGKVFLRVFVDAQGAVGQAHADSVVLDTGQAVTTDPGKLRQASLGLEQSAVAAVRQWTFEPARMDDHPVSTWVMLPVAFKLEPKDR
jgi:beta-lactamase regulating signal transducer with metallopeptidase domain